MQVEEFKKACKLLDILIEENDEKADVWYVLAFCLFKLERFEPAKECLKNAESLYKKFKLHDPELM